MEEHTKEKALAVLKQERDERLMKCQHEINELLRKYGCDLVAQPAFTPDGRVTAAVRLVDASGR